MFKFLIESRNKLTRDFNVDLHAIRQTKPFALKAHESLVVEHNVHIEQDELLLERRCQTTIALVACASTLLLLATHRIFFFNNFKFVFVIR
jgi:hypothetical protein